MVTIEGVGATIEGEAWRHSRPLSGTASKLTGVGDRGGLLSLSGPLWDTFCMATQLNQLILGLGVPDPHRGWVFRNPWNPRPPTARCRWWFFLPDYGCFRRRRRLALDGRDELSGTFQ